MSDSNRHNYLGSNRFAEADKRYFNYLDELFDMPVDKRDLVYNFPCYVGTVNLARHLFFYDLYKQVTGLAGHIADLGTYKGASFLFLAKLVKLFEPQAFTQVHAFDWFEGMKPSDSDDANQDGKYIGDYEMLHKLVQLQDLDDVSVIHKMNLVTEAATFFEENPWIRFKLIFLDCGLADVLESSLQHFWPHLVNGGILVLDHYNAPQSPSESSILEKHIGGRPIQQLPYTRQPTAYVVKTPA